MVPLAADRRGDVLLGKRSEAAAEFGKARAWAPTAATTGAWWPSSSTRWASTPRPRLPRRSRLVSRPVTTPSLRSLAGALALLAAAVLAGCASGSPRPKPAELPPNVDLIGVRQAWHATLAPIAFPLQVHPGQPGAAGQRRRHGGGAGRRNGAELGRAASARP
jgi:hypothetical protein